MTNGLASFYKTLIFLTVVFKFFDLLSVTDSIEVLLVITTLSIIEIGRDRHVQK